MSRKTSITSTLATSFTGISEGYAIVLDRLTTGILTPNQPNVLVDATGHARITDFGLATVTRDPNSVRSASGDQSHTARWTAPEILTGEGTYSREADIFSFAMVTIEVCDGSPPYVLGFGLPLT